MALIVVAEEIAPTGLEMLVAAGHEVRLALGLEPRELRAAVADAAALVVRSATQVDAALLAAAPGLVVVGRAGIGLDNVDLAAATRRGVVVVNAPHANVLSAAEHTFALLLAQARRLPEAQASLLAGRWERSAFEGVELHGKLLGIVGLGRVGSLVAARAQAFGMRVLGHDPYLAPERARQLGVELVSLGELVRRSDFLSVHLPRTAETRGLIGEGVLAAAKPGLVVVNAARGGVVDEAAVAAGIRAGRLGGAAFDVFESEPPASSPLFGLPGVVVTPHLGASTREAQDKAATTVAEQVVGALAGELVPFAVNLPAAQPSEGVRPFVGLARSLGRVLASLSGRLPDGLEVAYEGRLAEADTGVLTLSVLAGVLAASTEMSVSFVNVDQLAAERGLTVRESRVTGATEYVNLVAVRGGGHAVAGTITGPREEARIVMVDDHRVELPPAPHLLVVRNDDRPGMIGRVGTVLGDSAVSISSMAVGPSADGSSALMVLSTDRPVPELALEVLRATPGIHSVHAATASD